MSRYASMSLLFSLLAALSVSGCGDGGKGTEATGGFDQVAQVVARREDRVSVDDLARWLVEGRKDFVLIDVRAAEAYAKGHIDGARNLAVPELVAPASLKTLPQDRQIVLYSQGSETAAQAAVLLRLAGYDANLLLGGYNFWSQHVLNPDIHPTLADGEYPRVPEQQALACYFVGGGRGPGGPPSGKGRHRQVPAFKPPVAPPPLEPPPQESDEGC